VTVSPTLWAGVPFGNFTALTDWAGTYELWCRDLAQAIFAKNGKTVRIYPLGTYGGKDWLQAVQQQNVEFAVALGLAPPGDLASYDFRDASDFASWFFLISQLSEGFRVAAGLL